MVAPTTTEPSGSAPDDDPPLLASADDGAQSWQPSNNSSWDDWQWDYSGQHSSGWDSWGSQNWGSGDRWSWQPWGYYNNYRSAQQHQGSWGGSDPWSQYHRNNDVEHQAQREQDQTSDDHPASNDPSSTDEVSQDSQKVTASTQMSTEATRTFSHQSRNGSLASESSAKSDAKGSFSEKMAVPSFGASGSGDELGLTARSYLRQVEAWSKVTRTAPSQQALLLYQNLSGRAWVESEELNVEDLASERGLQIFKSWIRERYQEVEVSRIAETLTLFFKKMKRQSGQSIREFNSVFDRAHSRLLEIDCKLPEVARAWAYLNALGLSNTEELSLLASVGNDYSTAKLQKAAILHEKSLRGPWVPKPKGEGKGTKSTFMAVIDEDDATRNAAEHDQGDDTEELLSEAAAVELHEAYVAQESAKARYRDVVKARGVDPESLKRKPADEGSRLQLDDRLAQAKLRSYCAGCGRRGHWHKDPECPNNQSGNAPAKPRNPQDHQVHATSVCSGTVPVVVEVAYMVGDLGGDRLLAITDTACSKSVMGQGWLESYVKLAKEVGIEVQFLDCHDDFRFGASKLFHASYSATIMIQIRSRTFMLKASVVQGEVPLLMSRSALSKLGMIYDVEEHSAKFRNLGIEKYTLLTTDSGHPAIPVSPRRVPGLKWPSPQQWAGSEVIIVPSAESQYMSYMVNSGRNLFYPKKINDCVRIVRSDEMDYIANCCEGEALRLNLTIHSSWSVGEIRQVIIDAKKDSGETSSVPRGLASMTLDQLKSQAQELEIPVPHRATKGQLQMMIRDLVTRDKAEAVVTFGRHRGKLFKEVPSQYLEWAMKEVQARGTDNSGPDLVSLANYAKSIFEPEPQVMYDPELDPKVPLPSESSSCWESHWSELTETGVRMNQKAGYREEAAQLPKASPKKRATAEGSQATPGSMDQDVPKEVKDEELDEGFDEPLEEPGETFVAMTTDQGECMEAATPEIFYEAREVPAEDEIKGASLEHFAKVDKTTILQKIKLSDGSEAEGEVIDTCEHMISFNPKTKHAVEATSTIPSKLANFVYSASVMFLDYIVPKHVQSALTRLHQNLGHPRIVDMLRHLRYAGADEGVLKACKKMRCEVCARNQSTQVARPATLPSLLDMNQLVSVDVFHAFDANRVRHEFLSVIDHATTFHLVCEIDGHSAEAFCRSFTQLWGNTFGAPGTISADLETGLQGGITKYAEFFGSNLRSSAGDTSSCDHEKSITSEDMYLAVQAAVFGRDPRSPEELCGGNDEDRFIEVLSADRRRQREVSIRTAAKMAFFRSQTDSKFRKALMQRSRIKRGGYAVGELVSFYRIEKVATKRGSWRGPGTIIGSEGGNWWVSFGGRCHLVAEEHMRPSTPEEVGDILTTKVARDELEKLLNLDPNDPDTYAPSEDYEPSEPAGEPDGVDPGQELLPVPDEDMVEDMDFSVELEGEPFPELLGEENQTAPSVPGPVRRRVRHKASEPYVHSVHMMKRCQTDRALEKALEKELPWKLIPAEEHDAFRRAEDKQFQEHLDHKALAPISVEESAEVLANTDPSRILTSRFAYRDKHWSRRKLDPSTPWKHKARLVVSGHKDPDVKYLETDAPTINRLTILTLLQVLASRRKTDDWEAAAGDITAAFLNGDDMDRVLYLRQPRLSSQVRECLSKTFPVDDWEIDTFEYIGSHIHVSDEGVLVNQEAYASSRLFEIPIEKGQVDLDPATEEQRIDNQSLIGALSWLSSQSRPDLQCSVSLAQQCQKAPTVEDIKFTNKIAKRAWEFRQKGIWLRPLDLSKLEFLVYHDSAWANALLEGEDEFILTPEEHSAGVMNDGPFQHKDRKAKRANSRVASQMGILIVLSDQDQVAQGGGTGCILDWKSSANPRVCRSTFGAETTACSEAVELGQYVRSFVMTILSGELKRVEQLAGGQFRCITDCKSLYDHLHRDGIPRIPSDKRLAIDLAALRQTFSLERIEDRIPLFWVPTSFQLAYILTKPMGPDDWWGTIFNRIRLPFVKAG
ncbi:GIP [Symbiodinium sp. CCMP2592]|nr:GIP [Symbiodinium sp. CCMP2592]